MKGKELNSGIRGGLWHAKHYLAMGDAIWLFGWLVHRQTTQKNGEGLVLRGMLLTYDAIAQDTGYNPLTLKKWMRCLREKGYVSVKHGCYSKMVVRVLKAKKFAAKQLSMVAGFAQSFPQPSRAKELYIGSQSALLKERTEIEQKDLNPARRARALPPDPAEHRRRIEARTNRLADELLVRTEANVGSFEPARMPAEFARLRPDVLEAVHELAERKRMARI